MSKNYSTTQLSNKSWITPSVFKILSGYKRIEYVYTLMRSGKLKSYKFGVNKFIDLEDAITFIANLRSENIRLSNNFLNRVNNRNAKKVVGRFKKLQLVKVA